MNKEVSAGAILFKKRGRLIHYLLLRHETSHHGAEYWNFPKGHIEKGESEVEGASREIFEETGIKRILFIPGFRKSETYIFRKKGTKKRIFKIVSWRIAQVPLQTKPKISSEHEDFGWFNSNEAYKKLKYSEQKNIFKKAEVFLKSVGLNTNAQKIFTLVAKIPKGKVATYRDIAKIIGIPAKRRWVGYILNKNTDPVIPCHRVIMANGLIGGYNKGVKKKIEILRREGVEIKNNKIDLKKYSFFPR